MAGAAGAGGTDAIALQHWTLRFGVESMKLREALAQFARWLANGSPPWAAYRVFLPNRLCGLDKCPGVRPLGIGEIYRHLWAK